jgi:hypothetical protein
MICVPSALMLVFNTSHHELTEVLPVFFVMCYIYKGAVDKEKERALGLCGPSLQYSTE